MIGRSSHGTGPVGHRPTPASSDLKTKHRPTGGWDPPGDVRAAWSSGEELAAVAGFEELLAGRPGANVDHMAAPRGHRSEGLLSSLHGRAILADEVGLGKTIEAGLIMKELRRARGSRPGPRSSVRRRCESSGGRSFRQVRRGLRRRLASGETTSFSGDDASSSAGHARPSGNPGGARSPRPWDLLIVDEAHRLAGESARRSREAPGPAWTPATAVYLPPPHAGAERASSSSTASSTPFAPARSLPQRDFRERLRGQSSPS